MEAKKLNYFTIADHLEIERATGVKYEYDNGYITALAGGSIPHNTIAGNIFAKLYQALEKGNCRVFNSDTKINLQRKKYVYPDAAVVCGALETSSENTDAIQNPILVIEVLSPNTESYDRGDKFRKYRQIPTLQEYVLIQQKQPIIEIYERKNDLWAITVFEGLDKKVWFNSIQQSVTMEDIYRDVGFDCEVNE